MLGQKSFIENRRSGFYTDKYGTFVHCKMHITMCTLRANYVKEGGNVQTEENTLYIFVC